MALDNCTRRPHYHAIFFGLSRQDLLPALTDWSDRFGFYLAKDIKYTPKDLECSARYVSKYACKGVFENPFVQRYGLIPSFRLFSKGLGISYVARMKSYHLFSYCPAWEKYNLNKTISSHIGRLFRQSYLDEVLKRKCVKIGKFNYHMPRFYSDKIFKYEVFKHPLNPSSKAKTLVNSSLSIALANRAFELRCMSIDEALESFRGQVSSPFEAFMVSEASSFISRNYKAQQSLRSYYQRSRD